MANDIVYQSTMLPNGRAGVLKTDGEYREIVLGAFNAFNASGDYYTYTKGSRLDAIFRQSSDFMRRIESGQLYAEYGHPEIDPKMNRQDTFIRRMTVLPDRWCGHIRRVKLMDNVVKDIKGRPCIAVVGEVCPIGPFAHVLEKSFCTNDINTAFSVRCFTKDTPVGNVMYKSIVELVTWDFVTEPGIQTACKYLTPTVESKSLTLDRTSYSREELNHTLNKIRSMRADGYNTESLNRTSSVISNLIQQCSMDSNKITSTKFIGW